MTVSSSDLFSADVLIIGAGLAGSVAAKRLAEAGIDVLCLEQGEWHAPEAFRGEKPDWELTSFKQWHPNPNIRCSSADYEIDDTDSEMKPMIFNGVGGSTILYGAQWMRFMPSDFRTRSEDGVGDDWPFSYEELAPYYDIVERDFSVAGVNGDPAMPPHADYPLPPLPMSPIGKRVLERHARLGWHGWPGSNAIASKPTEHLSQCLQLGVCGNGCPVKAKASVDLTHWPTAMAKGGRVIASARVRRITHDRYGCADGAIVMTADGSEHHAKAQIVIVAANAIGTPRLLLSSTSEKFPRGMANSSGLVGKRFMIHPFSRAVGFFDDQMESWQGHWGQTIYSLEFARTRSDVGFVRGAKWNLGPTGGPLTGALFAWPGGPQWGHKMHENVYKWLGRTAIWGISCEDLPEDSNFIDLDPDRVDSHGDPIVRMNYRLSDNTRAMLAYNLARASESLFEAGAIDVVAPDLLPDYGWHPLGTCRMGDDPNTSVIDGFGEAHDVQGLFIIDGSVMVTGSCVNPAATIAAVALRTADYIAASNRRVRL
jgi:choline dehydrogenase-like flavoprotein